MAANTDYEPSLEMADAVPVERRTDPVTQYGSLLVVLFKLRARHSPRAPVLAAKTAANP